MIYYLWNIYRMAINDWVDAVLKITVPVEKGEENEDQT